MKIQEMSWEMVGAVVKKEKRVVLPLGSIEQHGKISLATDAILAGKVAEEAALPLGVPVYPALPYGVAPYFTAYPGTVSLGMDTYLKVIGDILDNLYRTGHRKILLVNGHGGNSFVAGYCQQWLTGKDDARIKFHNWWSAPRTWKRIQETEFGSSHASWMENFPWTTIEENDYETTQSKIPIDLDILRQLSPARVRQYAGDGNYGGMEKRDFTIMEEIWQIAVAETRDILETGWAD